MLVKITGTLKVSILVILQFYSLMLTAQININGVVKNQNNQALQNVHIAVFNKPVGTYSDSVGKFTLIVSPQDTLMFSMIGLESLMLDASEVQRRGSIQLKEAIYSIDQVEITLDKKKQQRPKTLSLGTLKEKKDVYMNRPKGNQVAVYMPHPNFENVYLKTAVFRFSSNFGEKKRNCGKIRVHLFEVNPYTKGPGKELLVNDIVRQICPGEKLVEIDLLQEQIKMPIDGVFVGFEFLGEVDRKNNPTLGPYNVWPEYFLTKNKTLPAWTWGKYWGQEWGIERGENALLGLDVIYYK